MGDPQRPRPGDGEPTPVTTPGRPVHGLDPASCDEPRLTQQRARCRRAHLVPTPLTTHAPRSDPMTTTTDRNQNTTSAGQSDRERFRDILTLQRSAYLRDGAPSLTQR